VGLQTTRNYTLPPIESKPEDISDPCLMEFRDGTGHLMIPNPTGFTQKLEKD